MSTPAHHTDTAGRPAGSPPRLSVVDTPSPTPHVTAPQPAREGHEADAPKRRARPQRGTLLAVCGLCGGAGTSTLTYLIGRYAASELRGPVLICDTGSPSGGLAAYADTTTPRSLVEVAELVGAGLPTGRPYTTTEHGLRVLATGPRFTPKCPTDGLRSILEDARSAHALTVIDCGTLTREADQLALTAATHIAWVLPATRNGAARAGRVLAAVNPYQLGRQLVIARHDKHDPKAPMRRLKALAQERGGPLILVPDLPDLLDAKPDRALEAAQVPLQAILGVLQR